MADTTLRRRELGLAAGPRGTEYCPFCASDDRDHAHFFSLGGKWGPLISFLHGSCARASPSLGRAAASFNAVGSSPYVKLRQRSRGRLHVAFLQAPALSWDSRPL